MHRPFLPTILLAASMILPAGTDAAEPPATLPAEAPADAEESHPLARVVVIGASIANGGPGCRLVHREAEGYREQQFSFAPILGYAIARPETVVTGHVDTFFYRNPVPTAEKQVWLAGRDKPTLLVAPDFLLWFAYGNVGGATPEELLDARITRLDRGLRLLEQFDCPVIVGDLPDYAHATGQFITIDDLPLPENLVALNQRIRRWAGTDERFHVMRMADLVTACRTNTEVRVGGVSWPAGQTRRTLLLPDAMHFTPEGLIAVSLLAGEVAVAECPGVEPEDFHDRLTDVMKGMWAQVRANPLRVPGGIGMPPQPGG